MGGRTGGGSVGCEPRIEFIVKLKKNGGCRMNVIQELRYFSVWWDVNHNTSTTSTTIKLLRYNYFGHTHLKKSTCIL